MAGDPFLLNEEEQEAENRRQIARGFAPPGFAAVFDGIPPQEDRQPDPPRQGRRKTPFHSQAAPTMYSPAIMGAAAALGPSAQAGALQGMIGNTMSAIEKENDSRVAQAREMRRMQHEKELEQMRLQALISRLGQSSQSSLPSDVINPAPNMFMRFT